MKTVCFYTFLSSLAGCDPSLSLIPYVCLIVIVDVLPLEGVPILDEEDEADEVDEDNEDNDADEGASATQADAVPNEQARAREHRANGAEASHQNEQYASYANSYLQFISAKVSLVAIWAMMF